MNEKSKEKLRLLFADMLEKIENDYGEISRRFWIGAIEANKANFKMVESISLLDVKTIQYIKQNLGDYTTVPLFDILLVQLSTARWIMALAYDGPNIFDDPQNVLMKEVSTDMPVISQLEEF